MINNERIVPVMKIDLLSLFGTILGLNGTAYTILKASDVVGDFAVTGTGSAGNFMANQPVKTLDFPAEVTAATVYFVAAYDFAAITVAGAAATIDDTGIALADVSADGVTLYKAVLASGSVKITAVTPIVE